MKMIEDTKTYLRILIETTFGFTPVLDVHEEGGMIHVVLGGSPFERSMLMGKEARTFQSIKQLLRLFSRRHGYFCDIYVKPSNNYESY